MFDPKKYNQQIEKKRKLIELRDKENKQQDDFRKQSINPVQNLTPQQKDYFRNVGGGQDSGSSTSSPPGTGSGALGPAGGQSSGGNYSGGSSSSSGNTSSTSSDMGNLGFSDIRLKENVELIGKSPSNINIYKFNYKDSTTTYQGSMAHEVPGASVKHSSGYLMVDYNQIDMEFKTI